MKEAPADVTSPPPGMVGGWTNGPIPRLRWYRRPGVGPTIVLLHGGGANASWWFTSVPYFGNRDLLLLELSGHGDSTRHEEYTLNRWASEVRLAIEELVVGEAIVVCHSMSGRIGVLLAAGSNAPVCSLVLVDTVIPTHTEEPVPPVRPSRCYATREEAVGRFRFIPPAPELSEQVRNTVGSASVRGSGNGWTWKFDHRVFAMPDVADVNQAIAAIRCPMGLIVAEESTVSTVEMGEQISELLGSSVETRVVEGVGHHLMLEAPRRVATVIVDVIDTLGRRFPRGVRIPGDRQVETTPSESLDLGGR